MATNVIALSFSAIDVALAAQLTVCVPDPIPETCVGFDGKDPKMQTQNSRDAYCVQPAAWQPTSVYTRWDSVPHPSLVPRTRFSTVSQHIMENIRKDVSH